MTVLQTCGFQARSQHCLLTVEVYQQVKHCPKSLSVNFSLKRYCIFLFGAILQAITLQFSSPIPIQASFISKAHFKTTQELTSADGNK